VLRTSAFSIFQSTLGIPRFSTFSSLSWLFLSPAATTPVSIHFRFPPIPCENIDGGETKSALLLIRSFDVGPCICSVTLLPPGSPEHCLSLSSLVVDSSPVPNMRLSLKKSPSSSTLSSLFKQLSRSLDTPVEYPFHLPFFLRSPRLSLPHLWVTVVPLRSDFFFQGRSP